MSMHDFTFSLTLWFISVAQVYMNSMRSNRIVTTLCVTIVLSCVISGAWLAAWSTGLAATQYSDATIQQVSFIIFVVMWCTTLALFFSDLSLFTKGKNENVHNEVSS